MLQAMYYTRCQLMYAMTVQIKICRCDVGKHSVRSILIPTEPPVHFNTYHTTMSPGVLTPSGPSKIDLTALTPLRPAEIKTYHQKTYERISPSTTYYGKEKTVPITGGGL